MSTIKRTYGSRTRKPHPSSSSSSDLTSPKPAKRKQPLEDLTLSQNVPPPVKRLKTSQKREILKSKPETKKTFTQLHFSIDTSILRTCSLCDMSYTKGAPQDESLHKAHCARVQRGMEWGKEEERESVKAGISEVASGVPLNDGRKGGVVLFRADVSGRMKSKASTRSSEGVVDI